MSQIPGTLMRVNGVGVLIRGEAGMGKSDTALMLLRAGHQLVADDAVMVIRCGDRLIGRAPDAGRGRLCLRGPGIIEAGDHFGTGAVADWSPIDCAIELTRARRPASATADWQTLTIHGIGLAQLALSPERPVAAIIELVAVTAPRPWKVPEASACD
jgi:HPr kinase/phosphorylase